MTAMALAPASAGFVVAPVPVAGGPAVALARHAPVRGWVTSAGRPSADARQWSAQA